jgi:hypothetical protein
MFGPIASLVVGAQLVLVAANGPPKVDVETTCRTSEREITKIFGSGSTASTFDGCMRQQNEAFERLQKDWATYPVDARAHCAQPKVYMPSYVEWLSCFESAQHLREMRKREAEGANANANTAPARPAR